MIYKQLLSAVENGELRSCSEEGQRSFLPDIQALVRACLLNFKSEYHKLDRMYNIRLVAYMAGKLLSADLFDLMTESRAKKPEKSMLDADGHIAASVRQKYISHLWDLKEAKNYPGLEGWSDQERWQFLQLRIQAHLETLVRLRGGFYELSAEKVHIMSESLENFISQELKTYYILRVAKKTKSLKNKEMKESLKKIMVKLVLKELLSLEEGESFSLEAGWVAHSIYAQFYRVPGKDSLMEVVVHDRRGGDPNEATKSTISLGSAQLNTGVVIENYIKFLLEQQTGVREFDKITYERGILNESRSHRFSKKFFFKRNPLKNQSVGNCVAASHDSLMAHQCGREMATFLRSKEVGFAKSRTRNEAVSIKFSKEEERLIRILQPNTKFDHAWSYEETKLETVLRDGSKEDYVNLPTALKPLMRKRVFKIIASIRTRLGLAEMKFHELKSNANSQYENGSRGLKEEIDRLSRFHVSYTQKLSYLELWGVDLRKEMLYVVENYEANDTNVIMQDLLGNFLFSDGVFQEDVYQVCYKSFRNCVGWPPAHWRSYSFFYSAHKFLDCHPELIEDAIKMADEIESPPEETCHHAAVTLVGKAWVSHNGRTRLSLQAALASRDGKLVSNALTIVGLNELGPFFMDELITLLCVADTSECPEQFSSYNKLITVVLKNINQIDDLDLYIIIQEVLRILSIRPGAFHWLSEPLLLTFLKKMPAEVQGLAVEDCLKAERLPAKFGLELFANTDFWPNESDYIDSLVNFIGSRSVEELKDKILSLLYAFSQNDLLPPNRRKVKDLLFSFDLKRKNSFMGVSLSNVLKAVNVAYLCDKESYFVFFSRLLEMLNSSEVNDLSYMLSLARKILYAINEGFSRGVPEDEGRLFLLCKALDPVLSIIIDPCIDDDINDNSVGDQHESLKLMLKIHQELNRIPSCQGCFSSEQLHDKIFDACFPSDSLGRVDSRLFGFLLGIAEIKSQYSRVMKSFIKLLLSDKTYESSFNCFGFKLQPHTILQGNFKECCRIITNNFKGDKKFEKKIFSKAKKEGSISSAHIAKLLVFINPGESMELYRHKLRKNHRDRSDLLKALTESRVVGRLSADGLFCSFRPSENQKPKHVNERMRIDLAKIGYSLLVVNVFSTGKHDLDDPSMRISSPSAARK
jgi:hypothetical protein